MVWRAFVGLVTTLVSTPGLWAQQARDSTADSAVTLVPVVVTAERRAVPLTASAAAVRLVNRTDIARRAGADLTTVLRDLPGVQVDPVVGSGAGLLLQGLGSDRVLVLLDGAPVVGRISGELDITRFDPAIIERIEVVEGPQSTLYGSAALGGVVNLLTRRDTARRVELTTQAGTFGQRDARGRVAAPLGPLAGSLDIGRRTVDAVPGHGTGTTGFVERWDAMMRVGRATAVGADLRLLWMQENQFYQTGTQYNFNDNWQLDALAQEVFGPSGRSEVRIHGSAYDHRFVGSATTSIADGTTEWDKQRVLDAEIVHRGALGRHTWLGGAKIEREWLSTPRVENGERAAWSGAAYGSADWSVGSRFRVVTGARITTGEVWGTSLAPRLAVLFGGPGSAHAKAGVARGFRAPSFKEQYLDFLNPQARYAVRGNPDLEPEHSWNLSAELGTGSRGARAYVRGFTNYLRDFIQTGLVGDSAGVSLFEYQNVGRARTAGAEIGATVTRGVVAGTASYAYLDTEDESTGEELLDRAAHTARGAVTVARGSVSGRSEVIYTSRVLLSRSGGVARYQEGYARLNLSLMAAVGGLQGTLGVDNAGDTRPEGGVTELGRRWFVGLNWGSAW
jgi:outer membrane receptor for ferrienterochelin and colicins